MGLRLTAADALRFDFSAVFADQLRAGRVARELMRGEKMTADVVAAALLHAMYVEG